MNKRTGSLPCQGLFQHRRGVRLILFLFLSAAFSLVPPDSPLLRAEEDRPRPDLEAAGSGTVSLNDGRIRLTSETIKNVGTKASEPNFSIKVYASADKNFSETWDTLLTVYTAGVPIQPGESRIITIEDIPTDKLEGGKSFYIGWMIRDVKDEKVTKNNSAHGPFPISIPARPDLAPEGERSRVAMGNGRFTLTTDLVRNTGSGYAESGYMLRIYGSADKVISENLDPLLKEQRIYQAIAPGQAAALTIEDIPTSKLLPGQPYYIGWIISEVRGETATGNNTARTKDPVKITAFADLAASDGGSVLMGNGRFTLTTGTVKNVGSLRAESGYTIDVYASADRNISSKNDILLKSYKSYSSLNPGQSSNIRISDIPTAGLDEGKSYYIGWIIRDVRGESETGDNAACCPSQIRTAAFPDLEAGRGGAISKQGNRFTLTTGTIRNAGSGRADSGYVIKVYASADSSISESQDILLKEFRVYSSLSPGQTTTLKIEDIPTNKLSSGKEYYIGWIISEVRGEAEKRNNTACCGQRFK